MNKQINKPTRKHGKKEECPHPIHYYSILMKTSIQIMEEEWDSNDKKTPNRKNLLVKFQESKNLAKMQPYIATATIRVRVGITSSDPPLWKTATCRYGKKINTTHIFTEYSLTKQQRDSCPSQ